MGRIILYANGNGENHGCEAISRSISELFKGYEIIEFINNSNDDAKYNITDVMSRKEMENDFSKESTFVKLVYKICYKLKLHKIYNYFRYRDFLNEIQNDDICFSIGGDNYCYGDITWLQSLNFWINKKAKTILFGVSIEPEMLHNKKILKDLKRYSLIIARESLTYDALCDNGLGDKSVLLPDPAFSLQPEEVELPANFEINNTVGINISPMIIDNENNKGMAYENYKTLIQYILEKTNYSIALIPHVVWKKSDDRIPINKLKQEFENSDRICVVDDCNCKQLKYIISKCRFFVGARTHSTIAAYSTRVPTLVVGYSVKAKGIAKDLFDSHENYVIPVQNLHDKNELLEAFCWIENNENNIREQLNNIIFKKIKEVSESDKILENI